MRYRIGNVSRLLGVATETIRYYEKIGLVVPERERDSHYRRYRNWDIHVLARAKCYMAYGFSAHEAGELLNDCSYEEVLDRFHAKEAVLEEELFQKARLLENLQKWEQILSAAQSLLGRYELSVRPALYRLEYQYEDELTECGDLLELVRLWISRKPFTFAAVLFPKRSVLLGDGPVTLGQCVHAEDLSFLGLSEGPCVRFFPERPCVHTVILAQNEEPLRPSMLKPALDFMDREGLLPDGDVVGRTVISLKKKHGHPRYHELWLPYQAKL